MWWSVSGESQIYQRNEENGVLYSQRWGQRYYLDEPGETCIADFVGIKTAELLATLWISYGHLACNKRAGFSFEFPFTITLTVIRIYRTVTDPKN